MPSNLGFVMHAAEGYTHALAVCCPSNTHGYAGLTGSRRAYKAQKISAGLWRKLLDRKIFYDALFDLLKAEVIFVEHLTRFFYIIGFGGLNIPRQLKANIKVSAYYSSLRRAERLLGKMRNLLEKLLFDLWQKLEIADLLPVLTDIIGAVVLSKLLLDYLHLLAQIVVALAAVYLLVCSLVELLLDAHDIKLMIEHLNEHFKSAAGVELFKQYLLLSVIKAHILCGIVGNKCRITADNKIQKHFRRHAARELNILVKQADGRAHKRLFSVGSYLFRLIGHAFYLSEKARLIRGQRSYPAPVKSLCHYFAQLAAGLADKLTYTADNTVFVKIAQLRHIVGDILLSNEEYLLIVILRAIERGKRYRSLNVKAQEHPGEYVKATQRQYSHCAVRYFRVLIHVITSL